MNISLPIIKAMLLTSVITLSMIIAISYISFNIKKGNVVEAGSYETLALLKDAISESYVSNELHFIKIINLGKYGISIKKAMSANFKISMNNEVLEWEINFISICYDSCDSRLNVNNAFSFNSTKVVLLGNTLFPLLSINTSLSWIGSIKVYNLFITVLTSNRTLSLSGEGSIKLIVDQNSAKLIRFFSNKTKINLFLNEYNIFSFNIEEESILYIYLNKLNLNIYKTYG